MQKRQFFDRLNLSQETNITEELWCLRGIHIEIMFSSCIGICLFGSDTGKNNIMISIYLFSVKTKCQNDHSH